MYQITRIVHGRRETRRYTTFQAAFFAGNRYASKGDLVLGVTVVPRQ